MAEGTLLAWLRPAGSNVGQGESVAEIETEKTTYEIEAPTAGFLHPVADVGAKLAIEGVLGYILAPGEAPPSPKMGELSSGPSRREDHSASTGTLGESAPSQSEISQIRASPIARRLAARYAIDLTRLTGRGPGGRIVESDVLAAVGERDTHAAVSAIPAALRIRQRIPLDRMRRRIAERLRESLDTAISLTITREIRADKLAAAQQTIASKLTVSVSYDALFIKLLAAALCECPELNAIIVNDVILQLDEVHVGFAVAVPGGVLVPVVRNADSLPLAEVVGIVNELRARALSGSLQTSDTTSGTVTITNLGGHGIDGFTPLLNPPQSATLGIGRIAERPVVEDGRVVPAKTCVLSLTFDHRVADGVPAAKLLQVIARLAADDHFLAASGEIRLDSAKSGREQ